MANRHQHELQLAYTQMCMDRIALGFEPFMIAVMFNPLPGSANTVARSMEQAIEAIYGSVLNRMFRHHDRMPLLDLPLWIACPDYPVSKSGKMTLREASVNDGRHMHVNALIPTGTRLPNQFNLWLAENDHHYAGPGRAIAGLQVQRIYETPEKAFDYDLKSLGRGRATSDDILVLPRTHSEMRAYKEPPRGGRGAPILRRGSRR